MTLKYESEILFDLMKRDGDDTPSDVLPYESELKEKYLHQVEGAYPKLQDYRSEWLNYNLVAHLPADFPVETLSNVTEATVDNVVPYAYRSAILTGQTLVNICKPYEFDIQTTGSGLSHIYHKNDAFNIPLQDDKQYSIWIEIDINEIGPFSVCHTGATATLAFNEIVGLTLTHGSTIIYPCVKRINSTNVCLSIGALAESTEGRLKGRIMVFEGDIRGFELSYFTGMQSVKMPVLTTTGKNLFDLSDNNKLCIYFGGGVKTEDHTQIYQISGSTINAINQPIASELLGYKLPIKKNIECLVISGEGLGKTFYYRYFGKDFTNLNGQGQNDRDYSTDSFGKRYIVINGSEFPPEAEYILLGIGNVFLSNYTMKNIQIEVSTKATTYEPYKSNILTVNEDVTLRSNGGVYDELNLLTGRLTQRIDENNEVLAQEVVKTVDLTVTDQDGNTESIIRPIEGTMHLMTEGDTIKPLFSGEVPVEAITQNLASFIEE